MRKLFGIRDIKTGEFICNYRTPAYNTSKALFTTLTSASRALNSGSIDFGNKLIDGYEVAVIANEEE